MGAAWSRTRRRPRGTGTADVDGHWPIGGLVAVAHDWLLYAVIRRPVLIGTRRGCSCIATGAPIGMGLGPGSLSAMRSGADYRVFVFDAPSSRQ